MNIKYFQHLIDYTSSPSPVELAAKNIKRQPGKTWPCDHFFSFALFRSRSTVKGKSTARNLSI